MNSVRHLRHHRFGKRRGHESIGHLQASLRRYSRVVVRRVVVGTIVVHRPVEKLQMAVAAARVRVKKIHEAEFAYAEFDTSRRERCCQSERSSLSSYALVAEWNDLPPDESRKVRICRKRHALDRADRIQISKASHSESATNAASRRVLYVRQDFCRMRKLITRVERQDVRCSALRAGRETIRSAVFSEESRVPLKNDVCMYNPVAACIGVRENS